MIAALKSEFPDMEVTILIGYRDFDYAQRAIRLGVSRFLLKPSNLGELNEAVEAMVHNLKKTGIQPDRQEPSGKEESEEQKNAAGSFIVSNAVRYMQEHFREKITLPEVAHFSRVFKKLTGVSAGEYRNHLYRQKNRMYFYKNPLYDRGFLLYDIEDCSRISVKRTGNTQHIV